MTARRTPIVEAGWLAALALTPVVVVPWSEPSGDLGKPVILRLLVLLMLGVGLASPAGPARSRAIRTIVPCWLAANALSTVTALSPAVSLFGGRGQDLLTIAAHAVLLLLVAARLWDPLESTCRHASLSIL